mmetsp:Transcript_41670/g.95073  ORF Transcript_41670/g.95073 Transcript_41670/m.95073 type:complete len:207 (+) Transcript_41670:201-821(+)
MSVLDPHPLGTEGALMGVLDTALADADVAIAGRGVERGVDLVHRLRHHPPVVQPHGRPPVSDGLGLRFVERLPRGGPLAEERPVDRLALGVGGEAALQQAVALLRRSGAPLFAVRLVRCLIALAVVEHARPGPRLALLALLTLAELGLGRAGRRSPPLLAAVLEAQRPVDHPVVRAHPLHPGSFPENVEGLVVAEGVGALHERLPR